MSKTIFTLIALASISNASSALGDQNYILCKYQYTYELGGDGSNQAKPTSGEFTLQFREDDGRLISFALYGINCGKVEIKNFDQSEIRLVCKMSIDSPEVTRQITISRLSGKFEDLLYVEDSPSGLLHTGICKKVSAKF